jgi:hypothetical protein
MAVSLGSRGKVAIAVALIVGAGAYVWFGSGDPTKLSDKLRFVCVSTGKFYLLSRDKVVMIPARNPDTNEETLVPCGFPDEQGVVHVMKRCRETVRILGEKNRYVDPETLVVRTPS